MNEHNMKVGLEHNLDSYKFDIEKNTFPKMCVITFTYVCNALCPGCPYTNSDIRASYKDTLMMPDNIFKIIADQCGEHGAWVRISGGGEPMLHPKAVELVEYAKKVGARVGLITNGSRFNEENLGRIIGVGVDMLEFSVDACDEQTYSIVRKGLEWDKLLTSVKRAVEIRNRLGSPTKIIASGVNQDGVDIDAVEKFWEPIVDQFQKRKYLTWGINDPGQSADPAPYLPPEERIPCPIIFERLLIDARGEAKFCIYDISGKIQIGNVKEKTISELWQNPIYINARQKHMQYQGDKVTLCADCEDWKYRSWKHNYWKIIKNAEKKRLEREA